MDNKDAEILVKTPIINKIPGIVSAKAIGICISGGNPSGPVRNPTKPGLNFPVPWAMNITPITVLNPINAISCNLLSENFASVNNFDYLWNNKNHFYPKKQETESPYFAS